MIADYFSVLANYKIASVGIIPACPFLAGNHAKSCAKKQDFHLVGVELFYVLASVTKWILLCWSSFLH